MPKTNPETHLRVALIYLGRRGAGGWISAELAQQLQNRFPIVAVTSRDLEQHPVWESLHTERIVTPTYRNAMEAILSLIFPIRISKLVQKIRQFRPDVLLFPMFHPWNALIQRRMHNIPSVVFVHDPHPHPDLSGWLYGQLEQASARDAERCIILSENLLDGLIRRGVPRERVDILPLGAFRIAPSRGLSLQKNQIPALLFFGRIVPYKGLEILLQAYADLRRTHAARLIIAGEGSLKPYRHLLANLPDVEIINQWIPETEIEEIFSRSDLLILPYTSASQSGVIPIAASLGLPVIATQTGGIPEQIEAGTSGWLVQPDNQEALATAIRDALDHPDLARQCGAALRTRYESQFSWERIARQLGQSLLKAAQDRGQA